jgi:hypothetical protein
MCDPSIRFFQGGALLTTYYGLSVMNFGWSSQFLVHFPCGLYCHLRDSFHLHLQILDGVCGFLERTRLDGVDEIVDDGSLENNGTREGVDYTGLSGHFVFSNGIRLAANEDCRFDV